MYAMIKAARLRHRKITINITPLIDVLFLLLIFFLVSSTFLEQPSIELELPHAVTAKPNVLEEYIVLISRDGSIYINDEIIEQVSLLSRLRAIYQDNKGAKIVLKADKDVSYGIIIQVIDAIRESGLTKIVALTSIDSGAIQ